MASYKNHISRQLTKEQEFRYETLMSAASIKGGWSNKTLKSLGIEVPATTGWIRRYILSGPDFDPAPEEPKKPELDGQLSLL